MRAAGALYVLSEPVFIDDTQLASLQYKLLAVNGQRARSFGRHRRRDYRLEGFCCE